MGDKLELGDRDLDIFFEILNCSITKAVTLEAKCPEADWEKIYQLARRNSLTSIMYATANQRSMDNPDTNHIMQSWKSVAFEYTIYESKKYFAIKALLLEAQKASIKLIFFKGCLLADLYPQYLLRTSTDTDIFVSEKERAKAIKLLEQLGYCKNEEHSKEAVPVYVNEAYSHTIELHFSLWEDYKGKKMDLLDEMELTKEDTLIEVTACGIQFLTMGYEEHLIYQMFHIIKHFATQSVGLRYLADITLYINRYCENIDIEEFWRKMKKLGYSSFCYAFFRLCVNLLNMDSHILDKAGVIDKVDSNILLKDMINPGGGVGDDKAGWQFVGLITPYLEGEETISASKYIRILKMLFPSPRALPDKCNYAKKYPILLPIAWIHKIIHWSFRYQMHYITKQNLTEGDMYGAGGKLAAAEYRLSLMSELGLVDKRKH